MSDATLVDSPIGLDTTIASTATPAGSAAAATLDTRPPGSTTLVRSTVLPRLEMVGTTPRLVTQGKPRYEHTGRLGEGGLGEVLGARDNDIDRDVAVKRLRPDVASPATLARFVEEVRTIGRLEHPNIVPIHDVGVDEKGEYYFVMKYVNGETLESIIEKLAAGDPLYHSHYGFERRIQIITGLLDALAFAHKKGIVHRDIKPANVMVGAYGEVVLMDWGIAKQLKANGSGTPTLDGGATPQHAGAKRGALFETMAGQLIGTPAYMSPEQARGEAVDERSDLYSLNVLLYEFLTLTHPLAEKNTLAEMIHAITTEQTPLAGFMKSPHQPSVGMDLSWVLKKGLAKDPKDRYQSATEMLDRLEDRAEGKIPVQCHITFVKRVNGEWGRFVDRHPIVVTMGMAAVAIALVVNVVAALMHHGG
ncbi:MAG: serine/threonine-protein kinase [Polyangiaceae bacterium]